MRSIIYCLLPAIFLLAARVLAEPTLGDAPTAPADVSGLPGGIQPAIVNAGFSVDTTSREQVREFYNGVYAGLAAVAMNSTAVTTNCFPGTNAPAFMDTVQRRINWFRALAGLPAAVTFAATNSTQNQAGALLMSANNTLQHVGIPPTWSCFTTSGTNAAANSNLALGNSGPDAITAYVNDYGANNYEVGHRRWILYPQTQVMGTGDVPAESGFETANATWVFDANLFGPRPATRKPFVSWPPAGYAPYPVVFPRWSFGLSNQVVGVSFTNATVMMLSNGVPVAITMESYISGYGENTLVWHPASLDPTVSSTTFPFSGTDTVYTISVSNIVMGARTTNYTYTVTVFDPAVPGGDYSPAVIGGPAQPLLNSANAYSCTPLANPNVTGYRWRVSQRTNSNFFDGAENGLVNFTADVSPGYFPITNAPVASGSAAFHLAHLTPGPQILELNRVLFPASNTVVTFQSELGYATADETARVQVSVDAGITWQDVYAQAGASSGNLVETSFNARTVSLASFARQQTLLRFDFDITSGSYYPYADPGYGWTFDEVVVTNCEQLLGVTTNTTASTNFTFTPTQGGNYNLEAGAFIFTDFPLDFGPVKEVAAAANAVVLNNLTVSNGVVRINFTLTGADGKFELLQAGALGGTWATNASATLTTNVPGSSYRFTTTNGGTMRYYRVQTP